MNPDPNSLTDSKFAFDSKRIWGAVMLAVPLVIQLTGTHLSADQNVQVQATLNQAQAAFADIMMLIGTVQMLWGSWKAQQPLHLFTPYQVDDAGKKVAPLQALPLTPDVARALDDHPLPGEKT